MDFDTIAAISTPPGEGAIAIIRLSGDEAIQIADRIFYAKKRLNDAESHTIQYGHIKEEDETIEEVMVSVMRAPRTFTREDVVEINCHGGIVSVNRVLQLLLKSGAR
ncbi:tRNA modification GTPase TrmE, partial [Listeria fleischmannii subsp. coloradonensis]